MCCVNEMICNVLLVIWNGFCIIMNYVLFLLLYNYIYGNDISIYWNMKIFLNDDNVFFK